MIAHVLHGGEAPVRAREVEQRLGHQHAHVVCLGVRRATQRRSLVTGAVDVSTRVEEQLQGADGPRARSVAHETATGCISAVGQQPHDDGVAPGGHCR